MLYIGSTLPVPSEETRPMEGREGWTEVIYAGNGPGTAEPLFHIDMFVTLVGRDGNGKFNVFVGSPKLAADALGVALWPTSMQEVFDNIAGSLERAGFVVRRNPLPLVYMDNPSSKQRRWYFATANNALVENIDDTHKRVWLPSYGHGGWVSLQATDDANVAAWNALGFTATLLGDFHPFAENLGAVHCIKKYLERG